MAVVDTGNVLPTDVRCTRKQESGTLCGILPSCQRGERERCLDNSALQGSLVYQ